MKLISRPPTIRPAVVLLGLVAILSSCSFDRSGVPADDAGKVPPTDGKRPDVAAGDLNKSCFGPDAGMQQGGVFVARDTDETITVDGKLDEWKCIAFAPLTEANAGGVDNEYDGGTIPISGEFAVRWNSTYLFVAVRVNDPKVQGDNTNLDDIWKNDSVEIFLDGDGTLTGNFEAKDHHYVVDHNGVAAEHGTTTAVASQFVAKVQKTASGYDVEAQIWINAVGAGSFLDGQRLGFNLAIGDGDGKDQHALLTWYLRDSTEYDGQCDPCTDSTKCCCGKDPDEPWCNTWRFGYLDLKEL